MMSAFFSNMDTTTIALGLFLATSGFLLLIVGLSRPVFVRMSP